jgi:hypothetical protein
VTPAGQPADGADTGGTGGTAQAAQAAQAAQGSDGPVDARRRADRLLRWYPRMWRDRYGPEFAELLIADIAERPRSPRRSLDVARGGIRARLADAGLAGFPLPLATPDGGAGPMLERARQRQVSASLGSFSCALGAFLVLASALWSQLLINWQWSALVRTLDQGHGTSPGQRLVQIPGDDTLLAVFATYSMLALLVLAVLAAFPVLATAAGRIGREREARLIRPAIVLVASLAVLLAGSRHFENNWLGTGGHHALIPSGLAAFIWALTLSVTSYWGHPALFFTLPTSERAWMAVSPFVLAVAVASATILVRRVRLSPRVAAFEACLGLLGCVTMAAFVVCFGVWLTERVGLMTGLPAGVSIGSTNATVIALLVLALAVAAQAARMTVRGLRRARA